MAHVVLACACNVKSMPEGPYACQSSAHCPSGWVCAFSQDYGQEICVRKGLVQDVYEVHEVPDALDDEGPADIPAPSDDGVTECLFDIDADAPDVQPACETNEQCEGLALCVVHECVDGACLVASLAGDDTPCDDGDPCTTDGTCKDGLCKTSPSCPAVYDECREVPCVANGEDFLCEVQKRHTLPGWCFVETGTKCYRQGEVDPANPCRVCDLGRSNSSWSPVNDGTACQYEANSCRPNGSCVEGQCTPGEALDNGTICDDGQECTSDDVCVDGACAGTPYTCESEFSCEKGHCDGHGDCTWEVKPAACLIDGKCWASQMADHPTAPCLWCDNDNHPREWSPKPDDTPCDVDGGGAGQCLAGQCVPD